jgi:RNA polymerase sigma-70 factor (ECF subfamily)
VNRRAEEFAVFYEASRDGCLRTVAAWTLDWAAAEDLVAEAFARAWASWRRVRVHPSPRAWVVRTALNVNVSTWRRYRRERERSSANGFAADPPSVDREQLDPDLLAALRRLPPRQRQVLALRVFLDLDVAQTASMLHVAEGTVNAHFSRALAHLRNELALTTRSEGQA